MFSPEQALERLVDRLPARYRPVSGALVTLLLWLLFLESAISIVTGQPFFKDFLLRTTPHWLWRSLIYVSEHWRIYVRDPVVVLLAPFGLKLDPSTLNIVAATCFGLMAGLRARSGALRLRRDVRRATAEVRKTPAVLYETDKVEELIKCYDKNAVEHDLPIVMQNLDKAVLYIIEEILWREPEFREAAINSSVLIAKTFGIANVHYRGGPGMEAFGEELFRPVMLGIRVFTEAERGDVADYLNAAIPYLFTGPVGAHFYRRIEGIFAGTIVERRAKRRAAIEIGVIVAVTLLVFVVLLFDLRYPWLS